MCGQAAAVAAARGGGRGAGGRSDGGVRADPDGRAAVGEDRQVARIPAEAVVEYVGRAECVAGFRQLAVGSWRLAVRASGSPRPMAFGCSARRQPGGLRLPPGGWPVVCDVVGAGGEAAPKATGKTQQEAIDRRAKRQAQAGLDLGGCGRSAGWPTGGCTTCTGTRCGRRRGPSRGTGCGGSRRTWASCRCVELDYRVVTEWQARLGPELAPRTVRHHRQTLAQVVDEAVKMGALVGNPVRAVKPLRVTESAGVALDRDQTRALLVAVADHRLGAAVALLFLQGWRVSEVLGLAWEDVDLDAGTAHGPPGVGVRRRPGPAARPAQDRGRRGEHWLMPTVVALLARRRDDRRRSGRRRRCGSRTPTRASP